MLFSMLSPYGVSFATCGEIASNISIHVIITLKKNYFILKNGFIYTNSFLNIHILGSKAIYYLLLHALY